MKPIELLRCRNYRITSCGARDHWVEFTCPDGVVEREEISLSGFALNKMLDLMLESKRSRQRAAKRRAKR